MSTSPIYSSGGTTLVRYEVEQPHLSGRGTALYPRAREFPRSLNYNSGISFETHPDYPLYDLPLSQRRMLGTLNEGYYRGEYPLSERTTLVTGSTRSGQQVLIHSGDLRSHSPPIFSSGLRTIDVAQRGGSTVVRRTGPRYAGQSIDLRYDEYGALGGLGKYGPVTVVPAGRVGGRRSYNSVVYDRSGFVGTAPCDYECGVRDPVLVPASRRLSNRRYL